MKLDVVIGIVSVMSSAVKEPAVVWKTAVTGVAAAAVDMARHGAARMWDAVRVRRMPERQKEFMNSRGAFNGGVQFRLITPIFHLTAMYLSI
jgi:hypothetical protein